MGYPASLWPQLQPDANQSTPLYLQLATRIEAAIRAGHWQSDQALPAERMLSQQLQVSRVTARSALDVLIRKGLVHKRHGSGHYVLPLPPELPAATAHPSAGQAAAPPRAIRSFSQDIQDQGRTPGIVWLSQETVVASQDETMRLALSPGAMVARLRCLHTANGQAITLEQTSMASHHMPYPERVQQAPEDYLTAQGHPVQRVLQHIRATAAQPDAAQHLQVPVGTPVLAITSVVYLDSGLPVSLIQRICRSDHHDIVIELRN
jgi:GntR family transcriptional regulator